MHTDEFFPRTNWVVVTQLLLLGFVITSCARPASSVLDTPTVHEVIDGDTIIVTFPGNIRETVRLLGVDTPETVDPSRPVQCFGAEASSFVRATIPPGTTLRLERDTEARDHFGRLLAYVYRAEDDVFVNGELLRLGYADISIYPPNDALVDQLDAAATRAKTQLIGLWSACGGADVAIDPPPRD